MRIYLRWFASDPVGAEQVALSLGYWFCGGIAVAVLCVGIHSIGCGDNATHRAMHHSPTAIADSHALQEDRTSTRKG